MLHIPDYLQNTLGLTCHQINHLAVREQFLQLRNKLLL